MRGPDRKSQTLTDSFVKVRSIQMNVLIVLLIYDSRHPAKHFQRYFDQGLALHDDQVETQFLKRKRLRVEVERLIDQRTDDQEFRSS